MDLGINHKVGLVFGAGSGLGRAMAVSIAREGVKVALAGRNLDTLNITKEIIEKNGGKAIAIKWDLADFSYIEKNFAAIEKELGSVDILVNNTGGPPPTPAAGQSTTLWLEKFQEMVLSLIAITDRALPAMKEKKWGRILFSTSSGAIAPIPNLAISNTLRASLHAWSKTLAREVAAFGITSNIIVPGRIDTDRIRVLDEANAKRQSKPIEEIVASSIKAIPMSRLGTPEEYGDTAAYLVSQPASYITGTITRVDGGQLGTI